MQVVNLPKTKEEANSLIDALTQAQYNYNREDCGMSAEDLATIFGKEKGVKLEKNYVDSYEQNYGRKPTKEDDEATQREWDYWDEVEAEKERWYD